MMSNSGFFNLDDDPPGLATGYLTSADPPETWRSNIYGLTACGMPDGGMISTAADMARFIDALVFGDLLPADRLLDMTTPKSVPGDDGRTYGYGLEMVMEEDRILLMGHSGSDPGVATVVSYYPDLRLTVVVLCNQDRGAYATGAQVGLAFGAPRHQ